ncbi:hypothetical protein [Methylococcus capsulatus]|uniref:hypothetical protein n=1 Tax=Methylococcus capsulatus TaxID=414 RepID=UPI001C5278F1|nr:hypothetical protein [Methylococcus capsulatus]QXP88697.1 hypothetical protein KW112_06220 [Methylococcus capsulatus]QXP94271.1 hypothetical protein KW113_03415 [Methylococcus capsulatus]UQN10975.1 hypothetical protein M3M30_07945 [Methylococcus capsulatus]
MNSRLICAALLTIANVPVYAGVEGNWLCTVNMKITLKISHNGSVVKTTNRDQSVSNIHINGDGTYSSSIPTMPDAVAHGKYELSGRKLVFRPSFDDLIRITEEGCQATGAACKVYSVTATSAGKVNRQETSFKTKDVTTMSMFLLPGSAVQPSYVQSKALSQSVCDRQ